MDKYNMNEVNTVRQQLFNEDCVLDHQVACSHSRKLSFVRDSMGVVRDDRRPSRS